MMIDLKLLRRRPWLFFAVLITFMLLLLLALFARHAVKAVDSLLSSTEASKSSGTTPDVYEWKTRSEFEPVSFDGWRNASTDQLCRSFPSHLLNEIQPVLKTGHGVLESRVRPQLNAGLACLTNLLTFSDVTEQFENLHFIDVLEDIPQHLVRSEWQLDPYRRLQACVAQGSKDCGNVLTRKEAWELDKWKFLPMTTRAWKMRPDRRWYVFFEADTMLFWDNIFRLLSNFDADVALYFGSPSPRGEEWFAFGGSGFILSREAMRRLVKEDWDAQTGEYLGSWLTKRYWGMVQHDCCGDSVVGGVLLEKGVHLGGLFPMFSPHPPHGVPFSDRYWCQPMIGMHKPEEEDVQGIFRWEFGQRQYDRPLLLRDLAVSYYNFTALARKEDWDNASWDGFAAPPAGEHYSEHPGESPETCASACEAHPACMQWTHYSNQCTFVRSIRLAKAKPLETVGRGATTKGKSVAGWASQRIGKWIEEHPCDTVQWVTPSVKRIF